MAIDADTGRLTWTASHSDSPVAITVQACNAAGCDTESWNITVGPSNRITSNVTGLDILAGIRLELTAPEGSSYQWKKDGIDLFNDWWISGVNSRVLVLDPLQLSDAGVYTCVYDNGARKEMVETEPFTLVVYEQSQVPAMAPAGLALAALSLLVTGVSRLGRKS
jgi:hypothetical protein